jgi:hypothetical protein
MQLEVCKVLPMLLMHGGCKGSIMQAVVDSGQRASAGSMVAAGEAVNAASLAATGALSHVLPLLLLPLPGHHAVHL